MLRTEILPNNKAENAKNFLVMKMGACELRINGKLVGQGELTGLYKMGHDISTYPFPLSRSVPPLGPLTTLDVITNIAFKSYICLHAG